MHQKGMQKSTLQTVIALPVIHNITHIEPGHVLTFKSTTEDDEECIRNAGVGAQKPSGQIRQQAAEEAAPGFAEATRK